MNVWKQDIETKEHANIPLINSINLITPVTTAVDDIHRYFYAPEGTSGGAPEGTSGGILKSHRPLQIMSQRYLINYWSKFDETSQKDKA